VVRSGDEASSGPGGAQLVVVATGCRSGGWNTTARCVGLEPGGLVSALTPVLAGGRGMWIGWPGGVLIGRFSCARGIELRAVASMMPSSSSSTWVFQRHTLAAVSRRGPDPDVPSGVVVRLRVGQRPVRACRGETAAPGATVWVHDYQLQFVPKKCFRAMRPDRHRILLAYPVPTSRLFLQLPWRRTDTRGLLGADLVGFQVQGAHRTSRGSLRRLVGASGTDTAVGL